MAGRNFHKNRTKERKQRQTDAREIETLRKLAVQYEYTSARSVASMPAERLRHIIKYGKQKKSIHGWP